MKLTLTDQSKENRIEVLVESFQDYLVLGTIAFKSLQDPLKSAFEDFEDLVNTGHLGELLDEASSTIEGYHWKVDGKDWQIYNLQIFDEVDISFRIKP